MPPEKSTKKPTRRRKPRRPSTATPGPGKGRSAAKEPRAARGTTSRSASKPDNAGQTQDERDVRGRFKPGKSGNPRGMAPGTRHRATRLAQQLVDGEVEAVTRAVIEAATGGDMTAAKLVLERILPRRRSVPVELELPPVESAEDLVAASGAILAAVAEGRLLPDEAERLARVLAAHAGTLETAQLARRLDELEELLAKAVAHNRKGLR